jgi:hypothetical protein
VSRLSVDRALSIGQTVVNIPVMLLMFAPPMWVWWRGGSPEILKGPVAHSMLVAFGLGFVVAWLWWSIVLPRWRLWAYERVDDVAELKRKAVANRLTWPDGSFFARTEIKTPAQRARQYAFERHEIHGAS